MQFFFLFSFSKVDGVPSALACWGGDFLFSNFERRQSLDRSNNRESGDQPQRRFFSHSASRVQRVALRFHHINQASQPASQPVVHISPSPEAIVRVPTTRAAMMGFDRFIDRLLSFTVLCLCEKFSSSSSSSSSSPSSITFSHLSSQ